MKKAIISIAFAITAAIACTQESAIPAIVNTTEDVVKMSKDIIDEGYLIFSNNQFELTISKDQAISLGYSNEAYNFLIDEIKKKNEAIRTDMEQYENFSIYADKSNSCDVVDQINSMIITGHITSIDGICYQINITLDQAIELNYTKEAYETAVQRIHDGSIYNVGFILQPSFTSVDPGSKASDLPIFGGGIIRTTDTIRGETQYFTLATNLSDLLLTIRVKFITISGSGQHNFMAQTTNDPQTIVNGQTGGYHYVSVRNEGDYIAIGYATTETLCGICQFNRI